MILIAICRFRISLGSVQTLKTRFFFKFQRVGQSPTKRDKEKMETYKKRRAARIAYADKLISEAEEKFERAKKKYEESTEYAKLHKQNAEDEYQQDMRWVQTQP